MLYVLICVDFLQMILTGVIGIIASFNRAPAGQMKASVSINEIVKSGLLIFQKISLNRFLLEDQQ